jgi:hypothetical protein
MVDMFTNYENNIRGLSCDAPCQVEPPKGIKVLQNVKGKVIGVQVEQSNPLQLYFHLEDICDIEVEELMPGMTRFEVLTTTHKVVLSHEYATAEILNQYTGDLYIFLTVEEMKTLKKEAYTMRVILTTAENTYEVFAEKDGYLVVR